MADADRQDVRPPRPATEIKKGRGDGVEVQVTHSRSGWRTTAGPMVPLTGFASRLLCFAEIEDELDMGWKVGRGGVRVVVARREMNGPLACSPSPYAHAGQPVRAAPARPSQPAAAAARPRAQRTDHGSGNGRKQPCDLSRSALVDLATCRGGGPARPVVSPLPGARAQGQGEAPTGGTGRLRRRALRLKSPARPLYCSHRTARSLDWSCR
jgi:hypothetical protein